MITKHLLPAPYTKCASLFKTPHTAFAALLIPTLPTEAQSWEEEKKTSYLWDAFNIIAETVASDSATNTTYNVWGLDIDGTLQGAGGVGGLLAVIKDSATYVPAWDANGNILEYIAEDGTIVAHREYDPFGGTVVATGDTDAFIHWFSTKPWCAATGLSEYQYRKYSPVLGRWVSRDPIGERGGINLYLSVKNMPVSLVDLLGWKTKTLYIFWFDDSAFRRYDIKYNVEKSCNGKNPTIDISNVSGNLVGAFDSASILFLGGDITLEYSTSSTASGAECPEGGEGGIKLSIKLNFVVRQRMGISVGLGPLGFSVLMVTTGIHRTSAEETQSCCTCDKTY